MMSKTCAIRFNVRRVWKTATVAGLLAIAVVGTGCGGSGEEPPAVEPAAETNAGAGSAPESAAATPEEALSPLDATLRDIGEKWDRFGSFTGTLAMRTKVPMGPVTISTEGSGRVESLKQEDVRLIRVEMATAVGGGLPGMGDGMTTNSLTVYDGTAVFTEMEVLGQKQVGRVSRDRARNLPPADGSGLADKLRSSGDLSLMDEQTVGGVPCYVIGVALNDETREKTPGKPVRMQFCYAKETGLRMSVTSFNEANEEVVSLAYADIEPAPDLDPARFVYTPPEGVAVVDMSDGAPGMGKMPF